MGLAVIAPFTEEELRSMWAYDRRCSDQGDYRMDLDPIYQKLYNMTKTGTIRYRVDIAQQVKNSMWHGTIYGREANQSGLCDG